MIIGQDSYLFDILTIKFDINFDGYLTVHRNNQRNIGIFTLHQ